MDDSKTMFNSSVRISRSTDEDFDSYFRVDSPSLTPGLTPPPFKDESNPATLYDSPEQSSNIRVEYGSHLRTKYFITLDETEVNQEFKPSRAEGITLTSDVVNLNCIQPEVMHLPEFKITDFENVRHLCNGSHSNIFKGELRHVPVIVKVLLESSINSEAARKEFEREKNVLSRLNHPHILDILGFGVVPSKVDPTMLRPMMALECLTGDTLAFHLTRKRNFHTKPFTELRYLRMAKEFADALYYIHDKADQEFSVIHRDLKPANIAFTSDGVLKLIDFGLCILVNKTANRQDTYQMTGCTGSLRYMAPEVALLKPYNAEVDIYAFGMIIYEIVTGCAPFKGLSKVDFYKQVIHGKKQLDLEWDDYGRKVGMNPALETLVWSCWGHNIAVRPSAEKCYRVTNELYQTKHLEDERDSKSFTGSMKRRVSRILCTESRDSI